MKKVEVSWVDSNFGGNGWLPIAVAKDLPLSRCISIGFLVYEDDEKIILTTSHEQDEDACAGIMVIPKVCIKETRELQLDVELGSTT